MYGLDETFIAPPKHTALYDIPSTPETDGYQRNAPVIVVNSHVNIVLAITQMIVVFVLTIAMKIIMEAATYHNS